MIHAKHKREACDAVVLAQFLKRNITDMIGWIYSDPVRIGLATGVTRGYQNFLEGTKTIVGTSNRFRVVTDVAYDDFMQLERPLGVARVPSRLAAPLPVPVIKKRERVRTSAYRTARSGLPELVFE